MTSARIGGQHFERTEPWSLDPVRGRWVAQRGEEVLFDADEPQAVVAWVRRHGRTARVWRVPASPADMGSALSSP